MLDENNQSEASEESPEATSPVPAAELVKEKKRGKSLFIQSKCYSCLFKENQSK